MQSNECEVAWGGSFGVTREAFVRRPEDDVAIAAEIIDPDTGSPIDAEEICTAARAAIEKARGGR